MTSLFYHHTKILNPLIIEKFNIKSTKDLPQLKSLIVSSSSKFAHTNDNILFNLLILLELITGQNPVIVRAKQSISNFKLRNKAALGGKVNISGLALWNLIIYLNLIIFPRLYNFKGFTLNSKSSLDFGIKDFTCFPEIQEKADKLKTDFGLTLTLLVKSNNILKTQYLLNSLQIPTILKI